ncbi:MAG: AmmeMemoRadiSam system protein B [Desulfovibrio sp.]|nr:AmmeMemoRadiSam system protein B [Desulfovibrio sp.]
MSTRHPIVAGRFYPADAAQLKKEIKAWLMPAAPAAGAALDGHLRDAGASLLGLMLPHAGYVYCGRIIGGTLGSPWKNSTVGASLPQRLFILCPNHTGQGKPLGVWADGQWMTPLGAMQVDEELAQALLKAPGGFLPDELSHLGEHSIEVLLPFLQSLPPAAAHGGSPAAARTIVPVCVGLRRPDALHAAGLALAQVMDDFRASGQDVGFIVSSDMNHYQNQDQTLHKDAQALAQALTCDPEGLLSVVDQESITMCGVGALALALFAVRTLGNPWAELSLYDTSAAASGNTSRVVGYAGLRFGIA